MPIWAKRYLMKGVFEFNSDLFLVIVGFLQLYEPTHEFHINPLVGISPKGTAPLATRHSPPATRHSPFATRHSPPATRYSPPATRNMFLREGTPQIFQKKNWKNCIAFCLFLVYNSTNYCVLRNNSNKSFV